VRNPRVTVEEREEAAEAALADACKLLEPLKTKPALSRAIVSWGDPDADPRDKYEAAIEFVIALLEQPEADDLLGAQASIVRESILPALRLGHPPRGHGPRSTLLRDRCIATVVTIICQRHGLDPYSNPEGKHENNGCAVVAKALARLEIELAKKTIERIYAEHKQT
jgi:hypothetical protein